MFVRTYAGAVVGIDAVKVTVEVNITGGPFFNERPAHFSMSIYTSNAFVRLSNGLCAACGYSFGVLRSLMST